MEVKLYVGNLADSISQQELQQLFSEVGTVVSIQLTPDGGGLQYGRFAYLTMSTDAEAREAIDRFHGFVLAGQPLKVSGSRATRAPVDYQSRLSAFGSADQGGKPTPSRRRTSGGGYAGGLDAFGQGKRKPALAPRRRGGSRNY
jgi:hypothetical protein